MSHEHHHSAEKNLKLAFFLNLAFAILEIIGGIYTNSVAIISDAIHDLGDSLALGLAWYLDRISQKGATAKFSFGFKRFSLLGALINSVVLIVGSIFVVSQAVERLRNPELSDAEGMILFALIGIAVNGYAAYKMSGGKTLNERVISWHLVEDVLGWVAILVAAIILHFYETPYLDPVLSLMITSYILWNVAKRLRETLFLFLQGVPENISVDEIEKRMLQIPSVASVHHSHIWSLDGENNVFSTHVKLKKISALSEVLEVKNRIKTELKSYHFTNCTVEVELSDEECSQEDS